MSPDPDTCHAAVDSRDPRFDGVFFVGVTSTGVYCRTVCPARTPVRANRRFFRIAAEAEVAGFRPCLRCRPELAPGHASVDRVGELVAAAVARISAGALDSCDVTHLAATIGVSARQLRRAFAAELGVGPVELAQSHRLGLAKRLLTDTALPVSRVAAASGFGSVRRMNDLFRTRYRMAPGDLRRGAGQPHPADASLRLELSYRPPYAWDHALGFLADHLTPGVEAVIDGAYVRTARLGDATGWLRVSPHATRPALILELSASLAGQALHAMRRIRCLFDLDARPDAIAAQLSTDPMMAPRVAAIPGMRLPGAFDGFEMAVRVVLGQQVSLSGANTRCGRVAGVAGTPVETPWAARLDRVFPDARAILALPPGALPGCGITGARVATILTLARMVDDGTLTLGRRADMDAALAGLLAIPGIGPWSAHAIAMRAMSYTDGFPDGDLILRRALGPGGLRAAEAWRPWRGYAAMYLWAIRTLPEPDNSRETEGDTL